MSMLYRVRLYSRFATPMYPFEPFAIHESGELRQEPGHGRVDLSVVPGVGCIPIPYEGGPVWRHSLRDGIHDAITEGEAAATSIAVMLDRLRQELLQA